jgi:hypothetical protein
MIKLPAEMTDAEWFAEAERLEEEAAGAFSIPKSEAEQWEKDKADRTAKTQAKYASSPRN